MTEWSDLESICRNLRSNNTWPNNTWLLIYTKYTLPSFSFFLQYTLRGWYRWNIVTRDYFIAL